MPEDTEVVDSGPTPKRRTAPITPAVRALQLILVLGVIFIVQLFSAARGLPAAQFAGILGLVALLVLVIAGAAYWQWRNLQFWFDGDGDLRVTSGVLQKKERRLQLSRLQSVEVVQPLLARVFGMAEVRVEVAGGGDSRVTLAYLSLADATAFRAETLARAAGVRPDAGEAPESVLAQVPAGALLVSLLLSSEVVVTALVALVVAAVLALFGAWPASLLVLGITGATLVLTLFGMFAGNFNFTVADSPDGLRTRSGLLGVQAHTVPPGRVASVEFVEHFLWRRRDWVGVRITVAGVRQSSDDSEGRSGTTLLPVATRGVAYEVVARILPGVDFAELPLVPVPERARWRSPFQWRNLGLGATEAVVATRRGWLTRRTTATPHARVQSVRLTEGPWERKLGLASVHFDLVPGPVRAVGLHRPLAEAVEFAYAEVERVHTAVREDASVRWGRAAARADSAARAVVARDDSGTRVAAARADASAPPAQPADG